MQQNDIKILLLPQGYVENLILPQFDSYIRDTDLNGKPIKRPVANNYWPAAFSASQVTPEGYAFAWVADTQNNRQQIKLLSEQRRICLDDDRLLENWFPKEDVKKAQEATPVVVVPEDLPLEIVPVVAYTREDLKTWTKIKLIEEATRCGKQANPAMKVAEIIDIILGE